MMVLFRLIAMSLWCLLVPSLASAAPTGEAVRPQLAGLRMPFIENRGQIDPRVAYYAPTFAGTAFVTRRGELVYALPGGSRVTETMPGGRARLQPQDRSATGVSAFVGSDPTRWRPEIPAYEQVSLGEVWSGVTVALRAHGGSVEKVFTLQPGIPVDRIRVRVDGAQGLSVDGQGALVARTARGPVTFTAPVAYQERDGLRQPVSVAYRVQGREYRFTVGAYDRDLPLVIDPLLRSTYLGGTGDDGAQAIVIHPTSGEIYVAGFTNSPDFPGTGGAAQPGFAGGGGGFPADAFVARLAAGLTAVSQVTFLGGSGIDQANAVAIHPASGDVYVGGFTTSPDFPATVGGAQPLYDARQDGFIARLPATLAALTQSTYVGGNGTEAVNALAIHPASGDVYVAGITYSHTMLGTAGGAQPAHGGGQTGNFPLPDAFVARFTRNLTSQIQATYLGGNNADSATALAIHPLNGDVYVAGLTASANFPGRTGGAQATFGGLQDAFVARLPSTLTALTQATYLGGQSSDIATALAINPTTGDVYVAGAAVSWDIPGTVGGAQPNHGGGLQDAFVARLPSSLTALTQVTYLGGSDLDTATALAIHPPTGDVYVAGFTDSANFPGTTGGAQAVFGGMRDAFVVRLPATLTSLTQGSYLGGVGIDTAAALVIQPGTAQLYVAGATASGSFPGAAGGAQPSYGGGGDAFVARLTLGLAEREPLGLSIGVNQHTFSVGQTLITALGFFNPGLPGAVDLYAGMLVPGGAIVFFTSSGVVFDNASNSASFRPIAAGVSLATPFGATVPAFFSYKWTGSEPKGPYTIFVMAATAGALVDGHITVGEIVAITTAPFTFGAP